MSSTLPDLRLHQGYVNANKKIRAQINNLEKRKTYILRQITKKTQNARFGQYKLLSRKSIKAGYETRMRKLHNKGLEMLETPRISPTVL